MQPDSGSHEAPAIVLTDEVIDEAVAAVHAHHGYAKPSGEIDNAARINAVFQIVNKAVVSDPDDRAKHAVTRVDLVAQVFPHLAGPEEWADQSDPELAERVYNKIRNAVWGDVKPDRTGKVQQMVGAANGHPAMVLCQTALTKHQIPAVYITRDLKCILLDNTAKMKATVKKAAEKFSNNLALYMERVPESAEAFEKDYKKGMRTALNSGQGIVTLALEEAVEMRDDDPEEGGE